MRGFPSYQRWGDSWVDSESLRPEYWVRRARRSALWALAHVALSVAMWPDHVESRAVGVAVSGAFAVLHAVRWRASTLEARRRAVAEVLEG